MAWPNCAIDGIMPLGKMYLSIQALVFAKDWLPPIA